jgi:chemotaxis protein histidine kinase CheA
MDPKLMKQLCKDILNEEIAAFKRKVLCMEICKRAKIEDRKVILGLYILLMKKSDPYPRDIKKKKLAPVNYSIGFSLLSDEVRRILKIYDVPDERLNPNGLTSYESWRSNFLNVYKRYLSDESTTSLSDFQNWQQIKSKYWKSAKTETEPQEMDVDQEEIEKEMEIVLDVDQEEIEKEMEIVQESENEEKEDQEHDYEEEYFPKKRQELKRKILPKNHTSSGTRRQKNARSIQKKSSSSTTSAKSRGQKRIQRSLEISDDSDTNAREPEDTNAADESQKSMSSEQIQEDIDELAEIEKCILENCREFLLYCEQCEQSGGNPELSKFATFVARYYFEEKYNIYY